jgi:serine/threonine protein kinase
VFLNHFLLSYLLSSDCPNVVPLLGTYIDEYGDRVLVLKKHEQFSINSKRSLEEVGRIFGQLFDTIAYMHSVEIAHLDLKWDNILWDSNKDCIVVADFDLACKMEPDRFLPACGTEGMYACMYVCMYVCMLYVTKRRKNDATE